MFTSIFFRFVYIFLFYRSLQSIKIVEYCRENYRNNKFYNYIKKNPIEYYIKKVQNILDNNSIEYFLNYTDVSPIAYSIQIL